MMFDLNTKQLRLWFAAAALGLGAMTFSGPVDARGFGGSHGGGGGFHGGMGGFHGGMGGFHGGMGGFHGGIGGFHGGGLSLSVAVGTSGRGRGRPARGRPVHPGWHRHAQDPLGRSR